MSDELALRLGLALILFALAIVWYLNRTPVPPMVTTSEWRVANTERRETPPYTDRRPMWNEPASKGIHGRRRA